eukprot:2776496-Alexandrium_andersonii.AAC.1
MPGRGRHPRPQSPGEEPPAVRTLTWAPSTPREQELDPLAPAEETPLVAAGQTTLHILFGRLAHHGPRQPATQLGP